MPPLRTKTLVSRNSVAGYTRMRRVHNALLERAL